VHGPFMKTPVKSNVFHLFLGKVQLVMLRRPTVSDVPATGLRAHTHTMEKSNCIPSRTLTTSEFVLLNHFNL